MMVNTYAKTWFSPAFGLLLLAMLSACGSSDQNSGTVAVNLSLAINSQQAYNHVGSIQDNGIHSTLDSRSPRPHRRNPCLTLQRSKYKYRDLI